MMRVIEVVGDMASVAVMLLFVPVAVLIVGTPIVLVVRLVVGLLGGL